jgi:hypothetical protein
VLQGGAPLSQADLAVVLLHGRSGSAENILELGSAFRLPNVAYLAPQAAGHTWYPLSFLAPREANEPHLSSALAKMESVVRSLEQAGFGRERVVVAGFSQGALRRVGRLHGRSDRTTRFASPLINRRTCGHTCIVVQWRPGSACALGTRGGVGGDPPRHGCEGHDKTLPGSASYHHAGRTGACPQLASADK